jgi:hypothetical protein
MVLDSPATPQPIEPPAVVEANSAQQPQLEQPAVVEDVTAAAAAAEGGSPAVAAGIEQPTTPVGKDSGAGNGGSGGGDGSDAQGSDAKASDAQPATAPEQPQPSGTSSPLPPRPSAEQVAAARKMAADVAECLRSTVRSDTIVILPAMPYPPPKRAAAAADPLEGIMFGKLTQVGWLVGEGWFVVWLRGLRGSCPCTTPCSEGKAQSAKHKPRPNQVA